MKRIVLTIFSVYALTSVLQAQSDISVPTIEWKSVPPQAIIEVLLSMRFEKVEFKDQNLFQCLKELSNSSSIYFGKGTGFNIIISHQPYKYSKEETESMDNQKISVIYNNITLRDILKRLADATQTNIQLTKYGCIALYGDANWRNAPSSFPPYQKDSGKSFNP